MTYSAPHRRGIKPEGIRQYSFQQRAKAMTTIAEKDNCREETAPKMSFPEIIKRIDLASNSEWWEDILRSRDEGQLALGDIEHALGYENAEPDEALAKEVTVLIQHVPQAMHDELRDQLVAWMRKGEPEERWNPRDYNFIGWVWEGESRSGNPIGFTTFNLAVERTEKGRIRHFSAEIDLVWINPESRKRRLATYLAQAIIFWFGQAKAYGRRIVNTGIRVFIYAEVYSEGGERFACMIANEFERLHDYYTDGFEPRELGWKVKELIDDIGW